MKDSPYGFHEGQTLPSLSRRQFLQFLVGSASLAFPIWSSESKKETVAIVGAGISGLSAANWLRSKGYRVIVLESRQRIGGRIWTIQKNEVSLDLGASWIHGEQGNPLSVFANSHKLSQKATKYDSSTLYYSENGKLISKHAVKRMKRDYRQLLKKVDMLRNQVSTDHSLGKLMQKALQQASLTTVQERHVWHRIHSRIEQDYATDVFSLSGWHWDEVEEFEGEDHLLVNGFSDIVSILAKNIDIRVGEIVNQITHNKKNVGIKTNKTSYSVDRVIVTVPLGVLKAGTITFSPALPIQKRNAIHKIEMGILNKVFLGFSKCHWPKDTEWFKYLGEPRGHWSHFFNLYPYLKKPVLVALNVGDFAKRLESETDREIVKNATDVLRRLFGKSLPFPNWWQVTRWASDPSSGGAYSFLPTGIDGKHFEVLAKPVGKLMFFAGEATSRYHYGTAHGAYMSGIKAAQQLLDASIGNFSLGFPQREIITSVFCSESVCQG